MSRNTLVHPSQHALSWADLPYLYLNLSGHIANIYDIKEIEPYLRTEVLTYMYIIVGKL